MFGVCQAKFGAPLFPGCRHIHSANPKEYPKIRCVPMDSKISLAGVILYFEVLDI